ncbi:MAG: tyrosine-type recombinase/integrase [Candidatus Bathyarchaeota archaeon]|nr:tyrosine-type recombinase/integrase [Candidatus Bathyarchaeota archaeon]
MVKKKEKPTRRTLKYIEYYPTPQEIHDKIIHSKGWNYVNAETRDLYVKRDRALVAILYLLALRISEALRLRRNQFVFHEDRIEVRGIKLSKSRIKDKPRKEQYRDEAYLPLKGSRVPLTKLVKEYLNNLKGNTQLFKFGRKRAWQIVVTLTGNTCHWFRAFGEDFLYEEWDHDLLAVADYVKVDPRTLQDYIRKRWKKYKAI